MIVLAAVMLLPIATRAADIGKTFTSAQAAAQALFTAANAADRQALRALFGLAMDELVASDQVEATNEFKVFVRAYNQTNHIVNKSETSCILVLGTNSWPFPIPIVKGSGGWHFDTDAGKDELLNRRIGRNELETIKTVRTYVDAQREYASRDYDGDQVLEYAQHLLSTPGTKDGLFWPPDLDGEISPIGPLITQAQQQGYLFYSPADDPEPGPKPFHGYYYKILTRQGSHAPGGKYNYIVNGNMIVGFALVAWPAQYRESGVMTFIVNQQGRVYQQDLGPKTGKLAKSMKAYDPDSSWSVSPD